MIEIEPGSLSTGTYVRLRPGSVGYKIESSSGVLIYHGDRIPIYRDDDGWGRTALEPGEVRAFELIPGRMPNLTLLLNALAIAQDIKEEIRAQWDVIIDGHR